MNEQIASYYIGQRCYAVYGCWDKDTPENEYDFYDVYEGRNCLTEGEPFYDMPTRDDVKEFVEGGE